MELFSFSRVQTSGKCGLVCLVACTAQGGQSSQESDVTLSGPANVYLFGIFGAYDRFRHSIKQMRKTMPIRKTMLWIAVAALFSAAALAQEKSPQPSLRFGAYDMTHEGTLVGTVVDFKPSSTTPPFGARLTLQTPAGVVDVHLGDARLLTANHFNIQAGDTLRIIGAYTSTGSTTLFLARIVQKGTQAFTLRTQRGFPVRYIAPPNSADTKSKGGVL
jgi:hypothetical protein